MHQPLNMKLLRHRQTQIAALAAKMPTKDQYQRPVKAQHPAAGYGLAELVISVAAGSVLIAGTAIGMRSISSNMDASDRLTSLRYSATTGLRLLRAETQRSLHLMFLNQPDEDSVDQEPRKATELSHPDYEKSLTECASLAEDNNNSFKPAFGMKMAELDRPVIYGLGLARNMKNFALLRCGPALSGDGRYEVEKVILSSVLENIGITPCIDSCTGDDLNTALQKLDLTLDSKNQNASRAYPEPAFAFETDEAGKMLRIIDPTTPTDTVLHSFLQPPGATRNLRVSLNFLAYARADKVNRDERSLLTNDGSNASILEKNGLSGCNEDGGCTFFGIPVDSKAIQLIVDGSGSMSTCIAWGDNYTAKSRTYYNGSRYFRTRQHCLMTRMESLQTEMRSLIESLANGTQISLQSFSSPGYSNHRSLRDGQLFTLDDLSRKEALDFVRSLSFGAVTNWGGTRPWDALDLAFRNNDATAIFFMTDGEPNYDRNGGKWSSRDFQPTADTYIQLNGEPNRSQPLDVNTVSVGQNSEWLKLISQQANGIYRMID